MPEITHRTLAPEEIQRAIDAGGPLGEMQVQADRMKEMSVAVVEVDGVIVAYWVVWYALHVEPLWVDPAWRRHPAVIGGIVQEMEAVVEATPEPAAFCVIEAENAAIVGRYARRLGFHEAPAGASLYYLVLEDRLAPVKV